MLQSTSRKNESARPARSVKQKPSENTRVRRPDGAKKAKETKKSVSRDSAKAHALLAAPTTTAPTLSGPALGPAVTAGADALKGISQEATHLFNHFRGALSPLFGPERSNPPVALPPKGHSGQKEPLTPASDDAPQNGSTTSSGQTVLDSNIPAEMLEGPALSERKRLEQLAKQGLVVPFTNQLKVRLTGGQLEAFRKSRAWTYEFLEHELKLEPGEGKRLAKGVNKPLPLQVVEDLYSLSSGQPPIASRHLSGTDLRNWRRREKLSRRNAAIELGTEIEVIRNAEKLGDQQLDDTLARQIPFLNRIVIDGALKRVPPNQSMTGRQFEEWLRIRGVSRSELRQNALFFMEIHRGRLFYDKPFREDTVQKIRQYLSKKGVVGPPMSPSDLDKWLKARGWGASQLENLGVKSWHLGSGKMLPPYLVERLSAAPEAIDAHLTGDQFLSLRLARGWKTQEEAAREYETTEQMIDYVEALGSREIPPELALIALTHPAPARFGRSKSSPTPAVTGNQLWGWRILNAISPEAFAKQLNISVEELDRAEARQDKPISPIVLKNLFKAGYDASKLGALRVSLESLKRVKPPNVTPSMLAKQARITTDTFNKFYHYNVPLSLSASLRLRRLYPSLSLSSPTGATGYHLEMFHKANGLTAPFTALKLGIPVDELHRLERLESQKLPKKVSRAMARQRGILPSHLGPPMTAQEINAWMKAHPMNASLLSMVFGLGPHSLRRISTSTKERTIDILSRKIHLLTSDMSKASSIGIVPAETMSGARFRFWRVIRGLDHAELAKRLNRTEEEIKRVERAGIEPIPWKKEVDHLSNKLPIKQLPPLTWSDVKFWRNARGITASHLMKRVGSARSLLNRELDGTAPADDFVVRWVMSRISATDAHVTGDELLSWRQKYHLDVPQAAMELQTSPEMIAYSEALGAAEIFPELASRMLSHPAVFQQKHSANSDTLTGGQLARLLPFLNLTETQFIKIVGTSLRSAYHYENHPELPIPDSWVRRLRNWAQRVQEEDEKQSSTESAAKYFA